MAQHVRRGLPDDGSDGGRRRQRRVLINDGLGFRARGAQQVDGVGELVAQRDGAEAGGQVTGALPGVVDAGARGA